MKQTIFGLFLTAVLITACHSGSSPADEQQAAYNEAIVLPGDSTVYGLACEGCTDSILVYLPFSGGDPDTLDILNARVQRRVFGRPDIGDEVAIVLSADDKKKADLVINIDRLKGNWCYMVKPRLRPRADISPDSVVQLPPNFPDSLRQKWFSPREYGIELRRDNAARTSGMRRGAERQQAPVEYPELKRYREWHIYNGHLLLSETRRDTLGRSQVISTDTADIVMLRRDSLVLSIAGKEQGYYRKQEAQTE